MSTAFLLILLLVPLQSAFKACHPKIKSFFFATDHLEEMNRWVSGHFSFMLVYWSLFAFSNVRNKDPSENAAARLRHGLKFATHWSHVKANVASQWRKREAGSLASSYPNPWTIRFCFVNPFRWMNRLGLAAIGYTPDDPVPRPDEGRRRRSYSQAKHNNNLNFPDVFYSYIF